MKKLTIFILSIILACPLFSYAASIGGALTQGKGKFSVGLEAEYISNRETADESIDSTERTGGPTILAFEENIKFDNFWRGTAKLSYGIFNYLDIYARIGESGFNYGKMNIVNGMIISPGPSGPFYGSAKIKGKNGLVWAVGLKGSYPILKTWYLGCDAQYLRQDNLYKGSGDIQGSTGLMGLRWNGKMTIQEWHIAPYLAKKFSTDKFGAFTPYVGGRYSYFGLRDKIRAFETGDASVILQTRRYTADKNWGPFCGLDYSLGEHLTFNVEGRFIDENALSFATTYKF